VIKDAFITGEKLLIDNIQYARWHYVYRLFSADDQLLYVGITTDPYVRWRQHQRTKEWADQVASYSLQRFAWLDLAQDAERRAITTENPTYNIRSTDAGSQQQRDAGRRSAMLRALRRA
jgi:hypothetical protein